MSGLVKRVGLEDYEEEDPLWWCLHHKNSLSYICIRLREYMALDNDEEREKFAPILDVILGNMATKNIGLIIPYEEKGNE